MTGPYSLSFSGVLSGVNTMRFFPLLLVCLSFAACGEKEKPLPIEVIAPAITKTNVELSEITAPQGCLNLSLIHKQLQSLRPDLVERRISTHLEISGESDLRPNFRRQIAYGNFVFEKIPLREEQFFSNFEQMDCLHVKRHTAQNREDLFQVKEATSTMLRLENVENTNQGYEISWASSQRILVKTIFQAYDIPCAEEAKPFLVETYLTLDWGPLEGDFLEGKSEQLMVGPSFLLPVAELVGLPMEDFFRDPSVTEGEERALKISKLEEAAHLPIKPELLDCSSSNGI